MSDRLYLWAQDQTWGGAVDKLIMMRIADMAVEPDWVAYDWTEADLAAFAETTPSNVQRVLKRLQVRRHLVVAYGREGVGFMLGAVQRREKLVIRMGAR